MTGLRAAVLGTGAWGTTFAAVLADADGFLFAPIDGTDA